MREHILKHVGGGAVMRCIMSDAYDFEVRKDYVTENSSFCGYPDVEINDGYSLNYHKHGYYGVEGARVIAKFVMIKDRKGRYVKRSRYMDMMKSRNNGNSPDYRRLRRYVRQMLKTHGVREHGYKALKDLTRNAGK